MKKVRIISAIAGLSIILASCGSSNNVVSNRLISKRKYTKGFHINSNGHYKSSKSQEEENTNLAQTEQNEQTIVFSRGDFQSRQVASVEGKSISTIKPESSATTHLEDQLLTQTKDAETHALEKEIVSMDSKKDRIGHFSKEELKQAVKKSMHSPTPMDDTAMLIILIILAILIPPLAVFIYEGATSRFWIDLILAIIGYGVGFLFFPHLAFLCGLAAVIYALLIVLEVI